MQTVPLSRVTVQEVENLIDLLQEVTADGIFCSSDRTRVSAQEQEVYRAAMASDDAQALGISMMRNGPTSQRTMRLHRQYTQDHDAA